MQRLLILSSILLLAGCSSDLQKNVAESIRQVADTVVNELESELSVYPNLSGWTTILATQENSNRKNITYRKWLPPSGNGYLEMGHWADSKGRSDVAAYARVYDVGSELDRPLNPRAKIDQIGEHTYTNLSASYSGEAQGFYEKGTRQGHFSATVELNAEFGKRPVVYFGTPEPMFYMYGAINKFTSARGEDLGWTVFFNDASIDENGNVAGESLGYLNGAEIHGDGTWTAKFYGTIDTIGPLAAVPATGYTAPHTVAGTFDSPFFDGRAIGAFGAFQSQSSSSPEN